MKITLLVLIALAASAFGAALAAPTAVEYLSLDAGPHQVSRHVTDGHPDVPWMAYRAGVITVEPNLCSSAARVGRVAGADAIVEVTQDGADVGVCE